MPKRRFGISVPSGLAAHLDELARALEVDRSTLVTEVLQEFMHDRLHVLRPHLCKGVLVVVSGGGEAPRLAGLYERYKEAIRARMHYHSEDACVDVLVVEAESGVVLRLERELRSLGAARTRYCRWPPGAAGWGPRRADPSPTARAASRAPPLAARPARRPGRAPSSAGRPASSGPRAPAASPRASPS